MTRAAVAMILMGVGVLGACDYPHNPDACASQVVGACGVDKYCADDGKSSQCIPLPVDLRECVRERWPGECSSSRDGGADTAAQPDSGLDARDAFDVVPSADAGSDVAAAPPDTSPSGDGGPTCTTACPVGHKQCQDGKVAECMTEAGCTTWRLAQTCSSAQTCQVAGDSASCICAQSCVPKDVRCGEGGVQECVLQDGCPVWGPATQWRLEPVATGGMQRLAYPTITAAEGRPQALYRTHDSAAARYTLRHAVRTSGGTWDSAEVEPETADIISEPVLRSDATGVLQAVHTLLGGAAVRLRSASKSPSGAWSVVDIPAAAMPQTNTSELDLVVRGTAVAMVYDGEGASNAGYVSWLRTRPVASGTWSVTPIVNSSERASIYPAVGLDASGGSFLSFFSTKFRTLTFSDRVQNETLENDADPSTTGYVSRIAFDSDGGVHVLAGGPSVRHFHRAPGQTTWQKTTVSMEPASELRLAPDETGGLHTAFGDGLAIRYAYRPPAGTWNVVRVPHAETGMVRTPDIAVDGGRVHVIYDRSLGSSIEYATKCR